MHTVLAKTFGGLSASYYFRHFIFGLIFPVLILWAKSIRPQTFPLIEILLMAINTLLYPYARFVYESIADFFIGRNIFILHLMFMLAIKIATMLACWMLAIFIAPIALVYLYFHHNKATR